MAPMHLGINKTLNTLWVCLAASGLIAAHAATPAALTNSAAQMPVSQILTNGLNASPEMAEAGALVSAIKSDLGNLQKNLTVAVDVVAAAAKARHEDYTTQVRQLARAIAEVGTNYLGDRGPLLKASGELSAKLEANKKRLQDRAQNPEMDEVSRSICITAMEDLKNQLERLGGARASLKLVRSEMLTQAKRLENAAETVAIIEETSRDSKAVEAFIDAIRQVSDFAKSLEKRLNEIGGPRVVRID